MKRKCRVQISEFHVRFVSYIYELMEDEISNVSHVLHHHAAYVARANWKQACVTHVNGRNGSGRRTRKEPVRKGLPCGMHAYGSCHQEECGVLVYERVFLER
jgi:hypothetical protein